MFDAAALKNKMADLAKNSGIEQQLKNIGNQVSSNSGIMTQLSGNFNKVLSNILGQGTEFNPEESLFKVKNIVAGSGEALALPISFTTTTLKSLIQIPNFSDAFKGLMDFNSFGKLGALATAFNTVLPSTMSGVSNLFQTIGDTLGKGLAGSSNVLNSLVSSIGENLPISNWNPDLSGFTKLKDAFSDLLSPITDGFKNLLPNTEWTLDLPFIDIKNSSVIEGFKELYGTAKSLFGSIVNNDDLMEITAAVLGSGIQGKNGYMSKYPSYTTYDTGGFGKIKNGSWNNSKYNSRQQSELGKLLNELCPGYKGYSYYPYKKNKDSYDLLLALLSLLGGMIPLSELMRCLQMFDERSYNLLRSYGLGKSINYGNPYIYKEIGDVTGYTMPWSKKKLQYLNSNMVLDPVEEDVDDKILTYETIVEESGYTVPSLVTSKYNYGNYPSYNAKSIGIMSKSNKKIMQKHIGKSKTDLGLGILEKIGGKTAKKIGKFISKWL